MDLLFSLRKQLELVIKALIYGFSYSLLVVYRIKSACCRNLFEKWMILIIFAKNYGKLTNCEFRLSHK